jgi:hypothetical protein
MAGFNNNDRDPGRLQSRYNQMLSDDEQKEDRATLSKWGNDLRQSFRTIATAAGVSEFDAKLLMNHAIPGVRICHRAQASRGSSPQPTASD